MSWTKELIFREAIRLVYYGIYNVVDFRANLTVLQTKVVIATMGSQVGEALFNDEDEVDCSQYCASIASVLRCVDSSRSTA